MTAWKLVFRILAIRRMFERGITRMDVRRVLANGEIIEDYPNDFPYPSRLVFGMNGTRPLHVVAAENTNSQEIIVITVYEPDPMQWELDFKRRK